MPNKRTLILDKGQILQKSIRIAYQILEDSFAEESIVLVGIADRGHVFATRLQKILRDIAPEKEFTLIKATIQKDGRSLEASTDLPADMARDKVVVLVDDVLNSGRTLAYGLGMFLNVPLKKMRTAVLIDRSHHQFPLFSDYYGLKMSTTLKEHVEVELEEFDQKEDGAWLS